MSLSRADVEKVALLARLRLGPQELDAFTQQLGQILGYVEMLSAVDTAQVAPMAHAVELHNVFREDTPAPSLDRGQALANAPKQDGECYLVPAVLGE